MDQLTETTETHNIRGRNVDIHTRSWSSGGTNHYASLEGERSRLTEWHQTKDAVLKAAERAVKKLEADEEIIPLAQVARLDFGTKFAPHQSPDLVELTDITAVKPGDIVWVITFNCWRRGVVEKVGKTNVTVGVVVESTGTFSRTSVKLGQGGVWWDKLNTPEPEPEVAASLDIDVKADLASIDRQINDYCEEIDALTQERDDVAHRLAAAQATKLLEIRGALETVDQERSVRLYLSTGNVLSGRLRFGSIAGFVGDYRFDIPQVVRIVQE